jgi:hypothetical protein
MLEYNDATTVYVEIEVEYMRKETIRFKTDVGKGFTMLGADRAGTKAIGRFMRTLNYMMHQGKDLVKQEKPRLLSWRIIDPYSIVPGTKEKTLNDEDFFNV